MAADFGAIWDLDGTLVDTQMNHYAAWRALVLEHGRDLTVEAFRPTFGLRNDDVLTDHLGFDPAQHDLQRLSEHKEDLFRASLERDGVQTLPGARELVAHLHGLDVPQAIASSAPPANIDLIMRLLSVEKSFDAVISAEEVMRGKPAPDIMVRAAQRLQLSPHRCVVLEDAPAGVQAGKEAGCRVIAITSTFPQDQLVAADLLVESFEEVLWPVEQWERFVG
jgi:HAD superfamily hydrolase (TIGR01509 family)